MEKIIFYQNNCEMELTYFVTEDHKDNVFIVFGRHSSSFSGEELNLHMKYCGLEKNLTRSINCSEALKRTLLFCYYHTKKVHWFCYILYIFHTLN